MVYHKYLFSEHWRSFRERAFEFYGKKCADCGTEEGRIEVHHLTYERLGKEELEDVVVLCHDCHMKRHNSKKPKNTGGKRPYVKLMQDVKGIEDISLDAAGLLLKLICSGSIEWKTGKVISNRSKKPLRSNIIAKRMNISSNKYKHIIAELRDKGLIIYRRNERAYFISSDFIQKG